MSKATGNNGGRLYSFGSQPVLIDCNFVVDSTNGNGLGIRALKGEGVKNVFMHTSASMTGTVATTANQITAISGGTSSLKAGMPVQGTGIPAGTTITAILSSSSVAISATPTGNHASESITYQAPGSPNPAAGLALIQLSNNYNRYLGGFSGFASPTSGGTLAINSTALTVGQPYIIASAGHAAAGQATIVPVADVSGSLASTYFTLYDSYGNTFIVWFSVSGVGAPPLLGQAAPTGTVGLHYVQQSITTNDTAATIGADLVITIENLPSGTSGVDSFTASGTTTVTVVNTSTTQYHLPGVPVDGTPATGFAFALTVNDFNLKDWQAVGLPKGLTPTVGQSFIATLTGSGSSTGLAIAAGVSGIDCMEVIGDPNQSLAPIPQGGSPNVGGWVLVQMLAPTPTTVDSVALVLVGPNVPTAPTNGSVCGMSFYVDERVSPSNTNAQN